MKQGRTLPEIALELQRQLQTRRDFIAATPKVKAIVAEADGDVLLEGLPGLEPIPFTDLAHGQIADDLRIPRPYYTRMKAEAPALLATNINHWFASGPQERMLRTLDGKVRAFLSSKYRPLDNVDLLGATLPAFKQVGPDVEIASCEVTERRLYIKAILPSLSWDLALAKREALLASGKGTHAEYPGADVVRAAVTISNSEVGEGKLYVEEGVERLTCYNLAITSKTLRKYHVGKRHARGNGGNGDEADDAAWELLSDEARAADDTAFWLRVRDVVKAAFQRERFEGNARKFAAAAGDAIIAPVGKLVEVTAVKYGLSDQTREGILQQLILGGDLTRYGLINAVTRASQDVESYDDATELERLGGKLIELPPSEWKILNSNN